MIRSIQDGGLTKYWFLKIANPETKVRRLTGATLRSCTQPPLFVQISIGDDDGKPGSRWILEKV